MFGRHRGTGNPGQTMFNRGGEPIAFDPFHPYDRKNAHGVILGPTGAGKSAYVTNKAAQIMAMIRPRLSSLSRRETHSVSLQIILRVKKSVNKVQIKPGNGVAPHLAMQIFTDTDEETVLGSRIVTDTSMVSDEAIDAQIPEKVKIGDEYKKYVELSEDQRKIVQ